MEFIAKIDDLIKYVDDLKISDDMIPSKCKVCITGAGGFIASHLAKRLKSEGFYVVAADWKYHEFWKPEEFCNEFHKVDLRLFEVNII